MRETESGQQKQIAALKEWFSNQVQNNPLGLAIILILSIVLVVIIGQTAINNRLGFEDKELWNWMELLVVPVIVAFVVWILDRREHMSDRIAAKERVDHEQNITNQRAKTDRNINNDRLNQQTLELCLEYISGHLLNAHTSPVSHSVKTAIIRARVLEAIDSLSFDYKRRDQILRFLQEMRLLDLSTSVSEPLFRGKVNLSNLKLRKADLRGVDFSGADLTSANLCGARLSKARFEGVTLVMARLICTSLNEAVLIRADLKNACLVKATLTNCALQHAELNDANLKHAKLNGAHFIGAHLDNANLQHADLSDADLTEAVLKGVNLNSATLQNAIIIKADLRESDLGSTILDIEDRNFNFVNMRGSKINESTFLPKKLRDILEIQGRTPEESHDALNERQDMRGEDELLDLLVSEGIESEMARNPRFKGADLAMADLDGAFLEGFDLSRADFTGSSLKGAKLNGSILHHAKFNNSDLTGAVLDGAEMNECDLTGATYTKDQLSKAINVPPIYRV